MHDNTLARALIAQGVDVQLIPLYTPIRTDETDVTVDRVFFGGVNVFLQEKVPLFRYLPRFFDWWFDSPWLIRWVTSGAADTDPKLLGGLTVSMLQGKAGHQAKEVAKLCEYLQKEVSPDAVVLTNMLIAGCVPEIKRETGARVFVTLQGDDIFLDGLVDPYKSQAFAEIKKLINDVDGFLTHSQFYAEYMSDYFGIPLERFRVTRLGVDTADFEQNQSQGSSTAPMRIGYLARLAPEKGLHVLVDAFIRFRELALKENDSISQTELSIAGWLGSQHQSYVDEQFEKLNKAGLGDAWKYVGAVDRNEKVDFLRKLTVLSVPTVYREPKGLFALESMAAGVPVVQPEHGAFPELIAQSGGGVLVRPEDPEHLAETLLHILTDHSHRASLANSGREHVLSKRNASAMAREFITAIES